MKKWKTLSTKVVKKNPWWEYWLDRFRLPSGKEGEYHYLHSRGSSFVVAVNDAGKIAWLRNYRYLFQATDWEIPGGGLEGGQTHLQAAKRELLEETGLSAASYKRTGSFRPNNGFMDETAVVFVVHGLKHGKAHIDETEQISLRWLSVQQVDALIAANKVKDAMSIAAWTLSRAYVVKLIDQMKKKR